mmetsp:Transcript_49435/g.123986  ORF Transcript_49435/g.123986 Transcript_49435/m.123986 type:complete len:280 (-) Transcript_49435:686-1525(-)
MRMSRSLDLSRAKPPRIRRRKFKIARGYCMFLSLAMEASQLHCSASLLAASPIRRRSASSDSSSRTLSTYCWTSSLWTRNPVSPCRMRLGMPPARAPITGTPLAIDSRTTKPSVSDSDGMTNMSPEANASLNASPVMNPVKTVLVPLKYSLSSSSHGPAPTNASLASGTLSSTSRSRCRFFSAPRRPMYTSRGSSGWPSESRLRMAADLLVGLKVSVSIPFCQTSTFCMPWLSSSLLICGLVTRVRSARLWNRRSASHDSHTMPGSHPRYLAAYTGRCV